MTSDIELGSFKDTGIRDLKRTFLLTRRSLAKNSSKSIRYISVPLFVIFSKLRRFMYKYSVKLTLL